MQNPSINDASPQRIFAVLFAVGSSPILILTLFVALLWGLEGNSVPLLATILVSPMSWACAQAVSSHKLLGLQKSKWLAAASVGLAYLVQWEIAWEISGHDGMAMGYALHLLNFFTAIMAFVFYLIYRYRKYFGLGWAFRSRE